MPVTPNYPTDKIKPSTFRASSCIFHDGIELRGQQLFQQLFHLDDVNPLFPLRGICCIESGEIGIPICRDLVGNSICAREEIAKLYAQNHVGQDKRRDRTSGGEGKKVEER